MPNDYPAGSLGEAPAPAPAPFLAELESAGLSYDVTTQNRAEHGRDWWPLSIADVAQGRVPHWPGVVVNARSSEDVSALLKIASAHQIPVTPQGGRSGVVGGAVAPDGGVALDLTGLNRIIATVGGWLACRGAGQYSNRYGKIEDIVRGLSVVLASGDIVKLGGRGPRQAIGPDLVQLFVGSEGTLGVITEATLVLRHKPTYEWRAAYAFATFDDGLEACRRILQRDAHPAVLRLYDEAESQRNFGAGPCALIVLDEGERLLVDATMQVVAEECRDAQVLDDSYIEKWLAHRNDVSALAPLWEHGLVVDTIEVAGPWSALQRMRELVSAELTALPATVVASVHQSHAYLDGACLYFTFAGKPESDPVGYYRSAWDVATRAVLESGGALSHHHGVGRNRSRFVEEALASAYPVLASLKATLDPLNIMNPGALGIGGEPW